MLILVLAGTAKAPGDGPGCRSGLRQFWAAVATSAPQPIGAVVAYVAVEQAKSLLPASFGFAAGAMLVLVAVELAPGALATGRRRLGVAGIAAGGATMGLLSLALGV